MGKNLTQGSVFKNIIYFALPYLASNFLQTLYGLADLFIIGQFSPEEFSAANTTAVSVGSQIMHMITVIIVGLAMGSTVMISRAMGAEKKEKASKSVGNTITLFAVIALVLTLLLIVFVKPISELMTTPEASEGTRQYLLVCFIGIPFITAYNIISSIFRGLGDTKTPMYFIAVACACNIGLDCLFIGALGMGPLGAALGTTISQTVSVIIAVIVIIKRRAGVAPKKSDLRLDKKTTGEILKVGVPVAVQDGLVQVAFIFITLIAKGRGLNDEAAVGIVEKIIGILFLVPSSMLSTVSALAAQNIGAKEYARARQTLGYSLIIAVGFGIVSSVAVFFTATPLVGLFTKSDEVAVLGGQYLGGYVWDCIFAGIHFCFSGYFCACRKSWLSFIHNITSCVLIRIPFAYVMSNAFPSTMLPMGFASPLASVLSVAICIVAYAILKKRIEKRHPDPSPVLAEAAVADTPPPDEEDNKN